MLPGHVTLPTREILMGFGEDPEGMSSVRNLTQALAGVSTSFMCHPSLPERILRLGNACVRPQDLKLMFQ